MKTDSRIYVAGASGMLGSALAKRLSDHGYENIITDRVTLTNQRMTNYFFRNEKPEFVFMLAGLVGGILANKVYPASFISDNLAMALNVIRAAQNFGTRKLIYVGCNCMYPKDARQPLREEYLGTGALESTNESFAMAKLAGFQMCRAHSQQYGKAFVPVVLCNLYGPGDSYDETDSHFMAALIRKFHKAKVEDAPGVLLWGTGKPRREVLYVDDATSALLLIMEMYEGLGPINVGCGRDWSIAEHAGVVAKVVKYDGEIRYDTTMLDGVQRKLLDITRLQGIGWRSWLPVVTRSMGIRLAYDDYLQRYSV